MEIFRGKSHSLFITCKMILILHVYDELTSPPPNYILPRLIVNPKGKIDKYVICIIHAPLEGFGVLDVHCN